MKKLSSLLVALLCFCLSSYSQETISGIVTDTSGATLAGASIREKGTRNGTSGGPAGAFTLKVKPGATLVVSVVGYETREVAASDNLTVSLVPEIKNLNEVVVTGVGVATSKRKVPIDISSVSSRDFAKSSNGSIEQGIMGQIAGAQIQQTSGQPNSGFNIILRGVNSLGGTYPMILLDGVEVLDLSTIDPATIDRVEVVKGAAAGMLYGAQGANGVIQLFSKRGSKKKMNITASSKVSWDNILRNKDIIASKHHYITDAEGYILDGNGNRIQMDAVGAWPDPVEDLSDSSKNDKPYLEPTFDHVSQSYRQAITQAHSVSVNGGADKVDYAFTTSYLNQQDVYSNKYRRLNLNLNLGLEIFKGFTVRSNTQTIFSEDNTLTDPNSRFGLVNSFAFIDFTHRDSLGYLVIKPRATENQHNPLSEAEWHQTTTKPFRFVQNFEANYNFPKFVSVNYKFGIDKAVNDGLDFYANQTNSLQGNDLPWGNNATGSILKYTETQKFINSLASLYVNTDFQKDFKMSVPIKTITQFSYDYRKDEHFFHGSKGSGLPTYAPYNINVASTTVGSDDPAAFFAPPVFTPGTFVTYGYLVNQTIEYGNLFGVSAGLRSDYSSEFGAASKPFTFYRGTAFFKPSDIIKAKWLTDWKIRGAYGEAGIQPGRYQRQVTLNVNALGNGVALSLPGAAQNPDLRVQVSRELEIGTDATLHLFDKSWFSRLYFSGTYWKRKSIDIIQDAEVAVSTGFATKTDNLTTISSKGFDLTIDATVLNTPSFVWNFGYRMGFAKSMVDKIANGKDVTAGPFSLKEGEQVGNLYGQYVIRDISQLKADGKTPYIEDADKQYYTLVNGIVVDTRDNRPLVSDADDLKSFGSVYPKFTAAFINSFVIKKSLNVSFQFDWYQGNKIYNISRQWLYRDRISKDFDNPVTIGNNTGAFVNYYNAFYNSVSPDDWFVEDGSFLRLRNASISYDFAPLLGIKWFNRAELTVAGRNLLTWSKYKGLDPENTSSTDSQGNDVSTKVGGFKGVDYFGVPNTRSYQVGISLGF